MINTVPTLYPAYQKKATEQGCQFGPKVFPFWDNLNHSAPKWHTCYWVSTFILEFKSILSLLLLSLYLLFVLSPCGMKDCFNLNLFTFELT